MSFPPIPHPRFESNAFEGTADYYVQFRPPYPTALLDDLVARTGVSPASRLLDLGTGPGRLAVPLASTFAEVWAVDPEAEMLEAGRKRDRTGRIRWIHSKAESLDAPTRHFRLATIGEAFHRIDQPLVAMQLRSWLEPGGAVASLGNYGILAGRQEWQRVAVGAVNRWVPRPASPPSPPATGPKNDEAVFRAAGFTEVASHPFWEERTWSIEQILGYFYSTSVCSRVVLGAKIGAFEADLTRSLLDYDPSGQYRESLQWGYTFGRQPIPSA